MKGSMKSKLLFLVSALALVVWLASIVLFMEMYEVEPQTWGPKGVEFEEWHKVWAARRDLYMYVGTASFFAAFAFAAAGLSLGGTIPCIASLLSYEAIV